MEETKSPSESLPIICAGDPYGYLLHDLEKSLKAAKGEPLTPQAYLKGEVKESCAEKVLKDPKTGWKARNFLQKIAGYDETKKSISAFDLNDAVLELYGGGTEGGWSEFLKDNENYSVPERIRILGVPLLDPTSPKGLKAKALDLLHSLTLYLNTLGPSDKFKPVSTSIDYFFNQKEPEIFSQYLKTSFKDFLQMDLSQKTELFAKAIKEKFPDEATVKSLFALLTFSEAVSFNYECFMADIRASLSLFETVPLPKLRSSHEEVARFKESSILPNLPQDTPFPERQKAIDNFLGEPEQILKTGFWAATRQGAKTIIKKYRWVGDTELFSIESKRPGPTTLIFAPHYHEDNPRKMFHWIKDIPLQSGRLILIPEANRAMGLKHQDTVAMNRIFNHALSNDRIDYLVVRRVEYLMGLVDGMIGLHDWGGRDPFFISDIIQNTPTSTNKPPVPSPWIPKSVQGIEEVLRPTAEEEGELGDVEITWEKPIQVQWKVAEHAAQELEGLSKKKFTFLLSPLSTDQSHRTNNSTAYMNFYLNKPAMTFEATAHVEFGQLHAMTVYCLLRAYGHQIDTNFENVLKKPQPEMNPDLYIGLPVSSSETTPENPLHLNPGQ